MSENKDVVVEWRVLDKAEMEMKEVFGFITDNSRNTCLEGKAWEL